MQNDYTHFLPSVRLSIQGSLVFEKIHNTVDALIELTEK